MTSSYHIGDYDGAPETKAAMCALVHRVYVDEGFTDPALARVNFTADALEARGHIIMARAISGELLGLAICATAENPARQVARLDEAEMQLLCLDVSARGKGIGSALCEAFEEKAKSLGYRRLVLSTQPQMSAAHRVYERLGYVRNPERDWTRGQRQFLVYEKLAGTLA